MDHGSNGKTSDGPSARPDRDTLRMWMSAYLDGELDDNQEAALMEAVDADATFAEEFELFCRASLEVGDWNAPAMEATAHDGAFVQTLQESILAATVPQTLSPSPTAAARLASQLADNALSSVATDRLWALLEDPDTAASTLGFLHATEATQVTVNAAATHEDVQEAFAFATGAVMDTVAADERTGITWMAYADGEADDAELDRVLSIADASRLAAVALHPHALEGLSVGLRALCDHPAAAKAGAAALQAIAAQAHLAAPAPTAEAAPVAPVPYFERLRSAFQSLAMPLVFASGAAALFVGLGGVETSPPMADDKTPPIANAIDPAIANRLIAEPAATNPVKIAWVQSEMFATLAGELLNEEMALREFDDLEVLDDNSATEVQTLESGSSSPMVFSTEASHITVIWVPDAGDDAEEMGT